MTNTNINWKLQTYFIPYGTLFLGFKSRKLALCKIAEDIYTYNDYLEIDSSIYDSPEQNQEKIDQIIKYIKSEDLNNPPQLEFDLSSCTTFQQKVLNVVLTIERGKTATYSDIAQQIGSPKAVRAIGTACNKNPILILIPCHRVISKSKSGIWNYVLCSGTKKDLLRREQI